VADGHGRALILVLSLVAATLAASLTRADRLLEPDVHAPPALIPAWRVEGQGRGTPAVGKRAVYFLTKHHEVLALDSRTGHVQWRSATGEAGDQTMGTVVLQVGGSVVVGDYNVVAFDAETGRFRWRFEPRKGYGPGIYLSTSHEGGTVFAGSPSGRVYSIALSDGHERWSTRIVEGEKVTAYQPESCGDGLFVGYTRFGNPNRGGVVAIDRSTGRMRWRTELTMSDASRGTAYSGGPACLASTVAVAGRDGVIQGFERRTGRLAWSLPAADGRAGDRTDEDFRPIVRSDGALIAGSLTGQVTAYEIGSRRQLWTYAAPDSGSIAMRLATDGATIYVPHMNGLVTAISAATGQERWRISDAGSGYSWPPAVSNGRVFLASPATGFSAFELPHQ
jgi:outer membrane protein assembly factor BamB